MNRTPSPDIPKLNSRQSFRLQNKIWDEFFENVISIKYQGPNVRDDFGFFEIWYPL